MPSGKRSHSKRLATSIPARVRRCGAGHADLIRYEPHCSAIDNNTFVLAFED